MNKILRAPLIIAIVLVVAVSGCAVPERQPEPAGRITGYHETPETVKLASWNIENFGSTKASDETRMRAIADILKAYDIIAVQEISNIREMSDPGCPRNEDACPGHPMCDRIRSALEQYLNEEQGRRYALVFSPQIKDERYLFIYDTETVYLEDFALVDDPGDGLPICAEQPESTGLMVRQPFKATFQVGDFDFVLLTAHTRPSMNLVELEGLEFFYQETAMAGEPDVIILGDLNADCRYLRASDEVSLRGPDYIWVVDDDSDTTVSTGTDCAYDRFIFKSPTSEDFTGNWGICTDIADNMSDHYLIWAEFWTTEDTD